MGHPFGFRPAFSLGIEFFMAFECPNKMEYLDELITVHCGVLEMQSAQSFHFKLIRQLIASLFKHFEKLGHKQDLDEIIELIYLCVDDAKVSDQFTFACLWVSTAQFSRHPFVSAVYQKAMSLMQRAHWFPC
ncbi:hypothetical protein B0F90DRAFT_1752816 [Multifurca ochricompacta]|uniref:Uncharacterized protein n=1 Tax=Multifurca ochricompacta TaxID=376703 RepID=A0AAD4LY56_9AGAM|nr:hypothetical protein B0F90DRAFT_1752816 [Multifurca ochricompacta]